MGAKKAASTISVWAVSDAQDQYPFPPERLEPGKYAISVRAAGYERPPQPTRLDLRLDPVTRPMKLADQLLSSLWLGDQHGGTCVAAAALWVQRRWL